MRASHFQYSRTYNLKILAKAQLEPYYCLQILPNNPKIQLQQLCPKMIHFCLWEIVFRILDNCRNQAQKIDYFCYHGSLGLSIENLAFNKMEKKLQ